MRYLLLNGLIFFFFGVNFLHGQTTSHTGLEIENHNEVKFIVEDQTQYASEIGLTKRMIESRVNVRLRQVGLKPIDERYEFLYIDIIVNDSGSVNFNVSFYREIYFYKGDEFYASRRPIYNLGTFGSHGGDPESIISQLDQLLDQFLSDYLDAND